MNDEASDLVVYTALFGSYETLVEQPTAMLSAARFICFTDDPSLRSDTWEVRLVESTVSWDPTRMARSAKIAGYRELGARVSIWIDNRVVLRVIPELIVERFLGDADIALPIHDHRASVDDEFREVLAAGIDHPWRVREQRYFLERATPDVLAQIPFWTAILIRRDTEDVSRAMQIWRDLVFLHSRRDQLSVNYALHVSGVTVSPMRLVNGESEIHTWLRADVLPKKRELLYGHGYRYRLGMKLWDSLIASKLYIRVRGRAQRWKWARAAS
ncbi:glycosyltransferase domain-containing protein [Microbacterium telephonicum]|uniref:Uncharacterized protein DUF616 n=1 Tax=Microbacterium telephonicum TaxID=1714841 RepID=A0A498BWD2_9MICO|nr:glycosyltransferase domain-containing protein [Microbacterium telephonicum]RLK47974.1 uncharacterized protein DUF616 [Microbacterium telephonicum]